MEKEENIGKKTLVSHFFCMLIYFIDKYCSVLF